MLNYFQHAPISITICDKDGKETVDFDSRNECKNYRTFRLILEKILSGE